MPPLPEQCATQVSPVPYLSNLPVKQALCNGSLTYFSQLTSPNENLDVSKEGFRIAKYFDMDNDDSVSFPELYHNMEIYLTMFLKLTDTNRDGSIYDDVQNGKALQAGIAVFETFLDQAFNFFDFDQNKVLSASDFIELHLLDLSYDTNGDGQITLEELIGSPMNKLPPHLYSLYKNVDKNEDEMLSHEEANDFLKRLLTALNTKPDCIIEHEEALGKFNLPLDCTTAIQEHVDNEIFKQTKEIMAVVNKLDKATNNDQKLTYTELIELPMDTLQTFMKDVSGFQSQQNGEVSSPGLPVVLDVVSKALRGYPAAVDGVPSCLCEVLGGFLAAVDPTWLLGIVSDSKSTSHIIYEDHKCQMSDQATCEATNGLCVWTDACWLLGPPVPSCEDHSSDQRMCEGTSGCVWFDDQTIRFCAPSEGNETKLILQKL